MRSKRKSAEKELDKEFKKIGVKPRIYHFRDVYPFNCVTIAIEDTRYNWKDLSESIWKFTDVHGFNPATHLLERLREFKDIYGVAICDRRDQYNRQEGRNRAKGRLLGHLINKRLSVSKIHGQI